jgi:hypothetical protein
MFTPDAFFLLSLQQRHGIGELQIITLPKHTFRYLDERQTPVTVARPVLRFRYGNAVVEKAMPMAIKAKWLQGPTGIAAQRVYAECEWGAEEIEGYIRQTVADLRDNNLVKGVRHEVHRPRP